MQARSTGRGAGAVPAVPTTVLAPSVEHDVPIRVPAWEVGETERQTMIAEAAYYRSAARGFVPGHELDDWLAAEAEIEALLQPGGEDSDRD
jgi:hypothetical protein